MRCSTIRTSPMRTRRFFSDWTIASSPPFNSTSLFSTSSALSSVARNRAVASSRALFRRSRSACSFSISLSILRLCSSEALSVSSTPRSSSRLPDRSVVFVSDVCASGAVAGSPRKVVEARLSASDDARPMRQTCFRDLFAIRMRRTSTPAKRFVARSSSEAESISVGNALITQSGSPDPFHRSASTSVRSSI